MRVSRIICWAIVVIVALIAVPLGWSYLTKPRPGQVKDEAMLAGFVAKDLRGSESDYLKDMDHGWDKNEVFSALAHALGLEEDELKNTPSPRSKSGPPITKGATIGSFGPAATTGSGIILQTTPMAHSIC